MLYDGALRNAGATLEIAVAELLLRGADDRALDRNLLLPSSGAVPGRAATP